MLDSDRSAEQMEMQLANLAVRSVDGGLGPGKPLERHIVIPMTNHYVFAISDCE